MEVDDEFRVARLPGEARAAAADAGPRGHGARQHGHLRLQRAVSLRAADRDAHDPDSRHDFGQTSFRSWSPSGYRVSAHRLQDSCTQLNDGQPYWRDVGTIDAYWEANIELTRVTPGAQPLRQVVADLDLPGAAAAGEVRLRRRRTARRRDRLDGLGRLHHQRLDGRSARCSSPTCACTATARSTRRWSCPNVEIGRGAVLRRVVVDRGTRIPPGLRSASIPRKTASAST